MLQPREENIIDKMIMYFLYILCTLTYILNSEKNDKCIDFTVMSFYNIYT